MRLRGAVVAATCWRSLMIASILLTSTSAKDAPGIIAEPFDNQPKTMEYFDDSDVVLLQVWVTGVIYRTTDAGESWSQVKDIPANEASNLYMHPFDKSRAYFVTKDKTHWKTSDRGETWQEFYTGFRPRGVGLDPFSFHASDPNKIIFNAWDCSGLFCNELALYTTDGFSTDAKELRRDTGGCSWAKSTALFTTNDATLDASRILCVSEGRFSGFLYDYRLLISDNFFQKVGDSDEEFEPDLEPGRTVLGVSNMAAVKKYIVAASRSKNTDEMALYVTDDTKTWHRAIFPHDHKLKEQAYTLLESTNYSIQLDVMTGSRPLNPMGVLFSSNSDGTYFTRNIEHTNRNPNGYVDFEKMAGVQGIVFVNTVENWKDVQGSIFTEKQITSSISFDDGRTWQNLKSGEENLHLHSVTDMKNRGRVLSSPAPGLVMGVGNTGKYRKDYKDGDLYVSDDAGVTWMKALGNPHMYEFGDQGSILLAIADGPTDNIWYSLNHGKNWTSTPLPEKGFQTQMLTTTLDSTSLKFLLIGGRDLGDSSKAEHFAVSVDFDGMQERTCGEEDMEKWYARVDKDGNPTCLMGHKQYYNRRKKDADCFLKQEFKDPEVQSEACECTDADFECDFNFSRDDKNDCIKNGKLIVPDGECKVFDENTEFKGSSGWRLIPGNECKRISGAQKDDPVSRKCSDAVAPPTNKDISHTQSPIVGKDFLGKIYLERTESSTGEDESIVAWTTEGIYLSKDHGKTWNEILENIKVDHIIRHPYFNDVIYFVTKDKKVYYSTDRGNNIRKFGVPTYAKDSQPMSFHPDHKDWIIWIGVKDKDCVKKSKSEDSDCHAEASLTEDRGDSWKTLKRYVRKCEFVPRIKGQEREEKLVYCDVKQRESTSDDNNPWQLMSTKDFEEWETPLEDIIGFATMSEFIVVATKDSETNMKAEASVDGTHFAEALFPPNLKVPHQSGYTALDSSTHSVFLLVTVEPRKEYKYGTIIKSNSNGTSYVLSLSNVNQDQNGYVDFEKTLGIDGVALANIVANPATMESDEKKKLKTKITHNDGADWAFLPPPEQDVDKKAFECSTPSEKCSLHIHGYTERREKSHTYSSPSAVGMMIGIGNVGEYLGPRNEADTFISADAGITWRQAQKGAFMWEFGDQGSIIVLVKEKEETKTIYYSLDEGKTWQSYDFSDKPMVIDEITTVPSDNSRNFVLWARESGELFTINLDFTGLTDKQCELDEKNSEAGDYYLWTPSHPKLADDCLFGHVSQYHRKRTDAKCYNGRVIQRLHNIAKNCVCTRRDFECDYNYFRESEGTCSLVRGEKPSSHIDECTANPDQIEYWDTSGYRRIPLTTCEGGLEMDKTGDVHPCPSKEEEFNRKHGIGGVGLFFAIVIPIAVAGSAGWWVWRNWEGKFGQIRLGESTFDEEAPYIKYPVLAISAIVAVIITLPSLAVSAWRGISGLFGRSRTARFTTRSSFARGADYAPVDEDEGELLGDESDEEA